MCLLHLEYFAKGLHLHRILKINHVFTAYIKRIILFSGIVLSSFAVSAEETETIAATTAEETHTEAPKADEKFNPTPMILHHIADSHEWDILEMTTIGLPCILYSSASGITTFQYEDGKEVNGYKCEHGGVVREDNAGFIDFSITKNVATMLLAAFILIFVFLSVTKAYTTNKGKSPKGLQSLIEPMVVFIRDDVAKPGIGPKYERYLPYILTIFFFILVLNLLGLIPVFPGGANVTGNIAFTLVMAVVAMLVINFSGNKGYWKHILLPEPYFLWPIMFPVEVLGILTKPIALMIRLFANMVAGHIIVLSLICLIFVFGEAGKSLPGSIAGSAIAIPFTLFISCIEVLVAFIQAFIFSMLTSVFIGMAVEEHGHGKEAHH